MDAKFRISGAIARSFFIVISCFAPTDKVRAQRPDSKFVSIHPGNEIRYDDVTVNLGTVECSLDKITIDVSKSQVRAFPPAVAARQWNPNGSGVLYLSWNESAPVSEDCVLQQSTPDSAYSLVLYPPFKDCNVRHFIEGSKDSIVHRVTNTIWWSSVFEDLPLFVLPYKMTTFHCEFVESLCGGNECRDKFPAKIERPHREKITMKFWSASPDALAIKSLSTPLHYAIGELLYVTVGLGSDGNDASVIFLENCFASSVREEEDEQVAIVTEGCPSENLPFQHGVDRNGVDNEARFHFRLFKLPSISQMYVRCEIFLCKSRCVPKCRGDRSKRSPDEKFIRIGTVTVSEGPLSPTEEVSATIPDGIHRVVKQPKATGDNTHRSALTPALLVGGNLLVLCLLGLVSYVFAKSRSQKRLEKACVQIAGDDSLVRHLFPSTKVELVSVTANDGCETATSLPESVFGGGKRGFLEDIERKNHHLLRDGKNSFDDETPLTNEAV